MVNEGFASNRRSLPMGLSSINVLSWNCRGASNQHFLRNLKDIIKLHNPTILAILEPKVSGRVANQVCNRIGWQN